MNEQLIENNKHNIVAHRDLCYEELNKQKHFNSVIGCLVMMPKECIVKEKQIKVVTFEYEGGHIEVGLETVESIWNPEKILFIRKV